MKLLRIQAVKPLESFELELTLTDGTTLVREVSGLLMGQVFDSIRLDRSHFEQVRVEEGTITWTTGADLCPNALIWGGAPPTTSDAKPLPFMKLNLQGSTQQAA